MNIFLEALLYIPIGVAIGAISFFLIKGKNKKINIEDVKNKAENLLKENKDKADEIIKEAKELSERRKESVLTDFKERELHIEKVKANLEEREVNVNRRKQKLDSLKEKVEKEEQSTEALRQEIDKNDKSILEKLSTITGDEVSSLKRQIIDNYTQETEEIFTEKYKNFEEQIKETANKKAKKILISIIQRISSPTSVESKTVQVKVPKDHIKGKILGKDAKNIFEFENILEVDIIFNDFPNTISISGFNLVNRKIAQRALEILIKIRGDINSKEIRESIKRAEKEVDGELYEIGRKVLSKMGLKFENKDLIKVIGRLKYRTSYGQNIMKHSMEVAWVSTMLGDELGLDVSTCKIGGFLHDLGKAIDQNPDIQGAHDYLTKELMEKYSFKDEEVHAAWTHHNSEAPTTPEALIVQAADAVSACRPGARQESIERYAEKIQALENTAKEFEGVRNTYAISAGRELRVIVDPETIEDASLKNMADSVALKIEENVTYPGTIKVNVIRRTQHLELAK